MTDSFSKIALFIFLALLASCGAPRQSASPSRADNAHGQNSFIKPEFRVFHISADSTRLYVKINTENFLYARDASGTTTASVQVDISVFPEGSNNKSAPWTKSFRFTDADPEAEPKILAAWDDFLMPFGKKYLLKITVTDVNKNISESDAIAVDKKDISDRKSFVLYAGNQSIPLFTDRVETFHPYAIQTIDIAPHEVTGSYYNRDFPLPPPPFSDYKPKPFDYTPDSTFKLFTNAGYTAEFRTGGSGFYHLRFDTLENAGFSIFLSEPEFPKVTSIEDMLGPLRYIVSGNEFATVEGAENPKAALENLWMNWAGSRDRARRGIKEFYNRVEQSNTYFSSYVEGWQTDRGLIYIVYGKPNKAYREGDVETWIYGKESSPLSVTFHFVKVINPFTDNDYRLVRQEAYKPSWYRAVDNWRSGRIY